MNIKILTNKDSSMACMYDSETDQVFGPVAYSSYGLDAEELLLYFIKWNNSNLLSLTKKELEDDWDYFLWIHDGIKNKSFYENIKTKIQGDDNGRKKPENNTY